jgi:two-component system, OmpR family, phosphate regulon response regulator PhoB
VAAKSIKPKVLVIEDDLNMRIYLCNLLRGGGFEAMDAQDQAGGLKKARATHPDLIVLDGMLPDEGSVEIYYRLKSDPKLQHIPVVMLSTIDLRAFCYYRKCRSLQRTEKIPEPEAYLTKPPEADELLAVARRLAATRMPAARRKTGPRGSP